jgi:hypothetical protein
MGVRFNFRILGVRERRHDHRVFDALLNTTRSDNPKLRTGGKGTRQEDNH